MKAIDKKLLRDLWALKTQVVSIALVIACGIGGFIASFSTHDSLVWSREHYYDTARFPHVFATAKRAPRSLAERIRAIPGVSEVELRVVRDAQLSLPGVVPPMIARLIGFDFQRPLLSVSRFIPGGRSKSMPMRRAIIGGTTPGIESCESRTTRVSASTTPGMARMRSPSV